PERRRLERVRDDVALDEGVTEERRVEARLVPAGCERRIERRRTRADDRADAFGHARDVIRRSLRTDEEERARRNSEHGALDVVRQTDELRRDALLQERA